MLELPAKSEWSTRALFCSVIIGVSMIMVLVLALGGGMLTIDGVHRSIGQQNAQMAATMRDRLQRDTTERLNDIRNLAQLMGTILPISQSGSARSALDAMKSVSPEFAWIGFLDPNGLVLAATGGLLEGASVAKRPVYYEAIHKSFAGDVHEALMLQKLLRPDSEGEPLRFVDVAAPVVTPAGEKLGVLAGHLNWEWATRARRELEALPVHLDQLQVLVLDQQGKMLLGPKFGADLSNLRSTKAALAGQTGVVVEDLDGTEMVVGYAAARDDAHWVNLGWVVLAMQPASVAFAPVKQLMLGLTALGIGVAVVGSIIAFALSRRLARPLVKLADAARKLGLGPDGVTSLPRVRGSREISELSKALRALLVRLESAELERHHAERLVEDRVSARTQALQQTLEHVQTLANTDPLTGVLNRRAFLESAVGILDEHRRNNGRLGIITLDIDHFKSVNDRFGHAVGDETIRTVAHLARSLVRTGDLVARFGGEEFVILLPTASLEATQALSERLRETLENTPIAVGGEEVHVTASLGCAVSTDNDSGIEAVIGRADAALYAAKHGGRNQVRALVA
jgi:diguanylate cyclase (GGDEF)-like protein